MGRIPIPRCCSSTKEAEEAAPVHQEEDEGLGIRVLSVNTRGVNTSERKELFNLKDKAVKKL